MAITCMLCLMLGVELHAGLYISHAVKKYNLTATCEPNCTITTSVSLIPMQSFPPQLLSHSWEITKDFPHGCKIKAGVGRTGNEANPSEQVVELFCY